MGASEEIKALLATRGFGVQPKQQQPSPKPAPPPQPQEWVSKEQEEYVKRWAAAKAGNPLPPTQPARPVAQVQLVITPPPQPVVTTPPPPAVRFLPNGEQELSLGASVAEMRAASKTQLQVLSRRRGEGRQPRSSGWHGATF